MPQKRYVPPPRTSTPPVRRFLPAIVTVPYVPGSRRSVLPSGTVRLPAGLGSHGGNVPAGKPQLAATSSSSGPVNGAAGPQDADPPKALFEKSAAHVDPPPRSIV